MRINGEPKEGGEKLTYTDYKAKVAIRKKQNMMMFASIFLVLLIVFLGVAKMMSPDVDISLGEEGNQAQETDIFGGVDSRLKNLQQEDENQNSVSDNEDSAVEEDGLVKIPKSGEQGLMVQEEEPVATNMHEDVDPPEISKKQNDPNPIPSSVAPTALNQQTVPVPKPVQVNPVTIPKTYRVYVGMYSTKAQAEVARGILQESGLGLTPNIRQTSGGYTLQVGAFSTKESAQNLSNRLLINNYPARVVTE